MAFGIYNYRKTGKGVQKGGPKKKPFFLFWEIFGAKFWKFFQINLIYTLFCLPVVTFGPATAAMTQLMRKFYLGDPIFVFHEFMNAFRKNFKQSIGIGIVDLFMIALLVFDINFYAGSVMNDTNADNTLRILLAISLGMGFFLIMMHFYIYPQIVSLNLNMRQILKNSFILMIVGFKRSFIAFFSWVAIVTLMVFGFPYTVLVIPLLPAAWMSFIATFCAYPVIQKHIIDPFYEAKGEKNPEYSLYDTEEEAVFEDMGGSEAPTVVPKENTQRRPADGNVKVKAKGKVIR